ncbi:MAG: LysM peptidoglycan-binding domain-containing protein [Chthoniobacterales bacterium]
MKLFFFRAVFLFLALSGFVACDRMITPRHEQVVKDANEKASAGEFIPAINLYERALEGSVESAEIHYQLALLYDDKMNEPLHALHHFKRYLTLAPTGPRAADAKDFMKRDELALITSLSGDAVVTHAEAARLRNDNLHLLKELNERTLARTATTPGPTTRGGKAEKRNSAGPRSHVVQAGDTLFSLSRRYYDSPDRWKDILKANKGKVDKPGKLKVGQTLTIP